jgi:hypothetical protein
MSAGDTGRYCMECGDWFDYIEGNDGRAYCSDDCERDASYCLPHSHHWSIKSSYTVACDDCDAEGDITVRYPTL